jgi:hypothetical protein
MDDQKIKRPTKPKPKEGVVTLYFAMSTEDFEELKREMAENALSAEAGE